MSEVISLKLNFITALPETTQSTEIERVNELTTVKLKLSYIAEIPTTAQKIGIERTNELADTKLKLNFIAALPDTTQRIDIERVSELTDVKLKLNFVATLPKNTQKIPIIRGEMPESLDRDQITAPNYNEKTSCFMGDIQEDNRLFIKEPSFAFYAKHAILPISGTWQMLFRISNFGYGLALYGSQLSLFYKTSSSGENERLFSLTNNYLDGFIHELFVACSKAQNKYKVYIDGALAKTDAWFTQDIYYNDLLKTSIGAGMYTSGINPRNYVNGSIAELAVWTGELSDDTINNIVTHQVKKISTNPAAYWIADPANKNTIKDYAGGADLTPTGALDWVTQDDIIRRKGFGTCDLSTVAVLRAINGDEPQPQGSGGVTRGSFLFGLSMGDFKFG